MSTPNPTNGDRTIVVRVEPRLQKILPNFLAKREEDLVSMAEALQRGDYEAIRVFGHRMKGTGGSYGLDWISVTGKSLENAAKKKNGAFAKALLDSFSDYLKMIIVVYE